MNKRKLLIDDRRYMSNVNVIALTYTEGIFQLEKNGPWDLLYLDHDLGATIINDKVYLKTGYDIMCWLELNSKYLPKKITLVTDSPPGRKSMQQVIDKLYLKNLKY